jgi:thiol-disulfide isomerase/thioredoxin
MIEFRTGDRDQPTAGRPADESLGDPWMSDPVPNPGRVWMYVVVGLAAVWMIGLALFLPGPRKTLENSGLSTPAVYDWSPVDLNGQPVPFSKFKGKTIFLNFWATWCPPCLREMPSIVKLAKNPRLRDKNIEFVCISRDVSTEIVREFVADKNWPMTILRADTVPTVFFSEGVPTTFVIAPDGQIVAYESGAADWSEPHVVDMLEKLAAASPAPAMTKQ